eukprot:TRINITY_DN6312_c0_g4_i3.p1 TRINITY_DN6312_c0_g4~~TRINITY_DN6312_c0_g4_i3.p1  ORF type:complete len:659 (+),score=113.80 TRINITY_DN6312_c0_g4_i3:165-2141(+)
MFAILLFTLGITNAVIIITPPLFREPLNFTARNKEKLFDLFSEELAKSENTQNICVHTLVSLLTTKLGTTKSINLMAYSGKRIYDMGEYKKCKESPESTYLLTGITIQDVSNVEIGVCYPKECTVEELEKLRAPMANAVRMITGVKIQPEAIFFSDVEKEMGGYGVGYCIFWGITGIFVMLSIIGTSFDGMHKNLDEKPENVGWKVLKCLSLSRSLAWFFKTDNPLDPNLDIFNGIRCLLTLWVVFCHTFVCELMTPNYNKQEIYDRIMKEYKFTIIRSGTLAVDGFLMISGFFAACSFFKTMKIQSSHRFKDVLKNYLYRHFRLFPVIGYSILLTIFIMPTIKEFPFHQGVKRLVSNCEKNWYMTLLYVNNFQNFRNVCMAWSWYLMVDMQFFILCPIFVALFLYSKLVNNIVLASVSIVSVITTAFIYSYNGLHASSVNGFDLDYFNLFYNKPYCRIIPYLMGIYFFCMYTEIKKGRMQRLNNFVSRGGKYLLYAFGVTIMLLSILWIQYFDLNPNSWSQGLATFHELTFRPAFAFGLMCIVYPTLIGDGELLRKLLGHAIFSSVSKLTYSIYMVHLIVLNIVMFHGLNGHYSTLFGMTMSFLINFSISLLVSFFILIFIENPLSQINRTFIGKRKALTKPSEEAKLLLNESVIKP